MRLKSQYLQALKIATVHENFSYRIDKIIDKMIDKIKNYTPSKLNAKREKNIA